MIDKVQKIREEVVRLMNELIQEREKGYGSDVDDACILELQNLLTYIDSLQEEPKFKTGDRIKPIDSCLGSTRTIVDVRDSWYVTDQGTLDFEYEGNWELAEEHKKCMYSKDNYTNEDRKALCNGCEEECEYNKKKESVSKRFAFKAIPRLLEMIEPTDRAKVYVTKLADALEVEGYSTDAKIVMESLKIMNGEKVPMATMDEEPVSKDLEKAAVEAFKQIVDSGKNNFLEIFKAGAEWQKTEYVDENFKQCENGKTKIAYMLETDWKTDFNDIDWNADDVIEFAKHFFELGLKSQKGE